jgi:hypothetical protein
MIWTEFGYDVESFGNVFTCVVKRIDNGYRWIFEITPWCDHSPQLVAFLRTLAATGSARMVGFNNVGYDYPMLHEIVRIHAAQGFVLPEQLYAKTQQIIGAPDNQKFGNVIWQPIVPQLDLYKIHHFDNRAKATGLKALEFCMRADTIADLPFEPGSILTREDMPTVLRYNVHDVNETIRFRKFSEPMIKFRDELSEKFGEDFINFNDTKIGKATFIRELEAAAPGACFTRDGNGKRVPRQTFRHEIRPADIIFPTVSFRRPEFQRVLDYFRSTTIRDTKGDDAFKNLSAVLDGFQFDFGTGGIHGSVKNRIVREDADHELIDADVTSYYPSIAIANKVFPLHLGEKFCEIYADLKKQRGTYSKKSSESAMLKLALNGVYGDSGNVHSPFYDPQYTMTITINGQLLLCMLAESLMAIPGVELIQINTDGMTCRVHKSARSQYDAWCAAWEKHTGMTLEFVNYRAMFIRDVNNYIAQSVGGKVKRKGVYQFDTTDPNNISISRTWSQDWSNLVVPMAAEAYLLHGTPIAQFIANHSDPYDFMMCAKVPRTSRLVADFGGNRDTRLQNTTRYHIARSGPQLVKIMPPLPKKPDTERRIKINAGWSAQVCDHVENFSWANLDHSWYVMEAEKLCQMK